MKKCGNCGHPLPGESTPKRVYCDGTCRKAAWRKRKQEELIDEWSPDTGRVFHQR